ncbi:GIY-YIG nuclease family protein [Candidatus Lucifugimonas marina]|uniref:GIY-YIG nuclease family protein n=1 Tax=Candidatus Lucifugimonas marina TaxID=3038979 RepID=A0AAJ5ZC05_9CHLR|nr:GIY-YIG nuclease family protein [SAR202 cluster bacterium JH702]MDG0869925.1 GIY-YIG nuclease family protein [SAR202 cluster bacterium JH639]WFG34649.1 GIY-YIG nuclease family protein [SAR202 cluster bacterium JH545]WFG38577.1 GIY-YIG nuclease family protein [SAR202 cluster bacterium JH1073]
MPDHLYILECADGSYYTGSTTNVEYRIETHNSGLGGEWTSTRLPLRVAFAQDFAHIAEAFAAERQVKGWSRAKKQALISGRFDLLPELARSHSRRTNLAT